MCFDLGIQPLTRAGDGLRTHDNNVGNVVLSQLSYTRILSPYVTGSRSGGRPVRPDGNKGLYGGYNRLQGQLPAPRSVFARGF